MFSPVYLSGMVFSIRLVFIISITTADGGIGGKWYLSQEHSQDNASPDSITSVSSACVNSTGRPAVQICFLRKISCTVINHEIIYNNEIIKHGHSNMNIELTSLATSK